MMPPARTAPVLLALALALAATSCTPMPERPAATPGPRARATASTTTTTTTAATNGPTPSGAIDASTGAMPDALAIAAADDAATEDAATDDAPPVALAAFEPAALPSDEPPPPLPAVMPTGCPPPPRPHQPPPTTRPWRPTHLVAEETLPEPEAPAPRHASLAALRGSGVWIWRARLCENGDAAAIVARAQRAGIKQLWVRVGDSHDGFYGAPVLETLVPAAHAAGIAVIGWGFPFLWDPAADAAWTRAALEWHGASGDALDGFSPDIETHSEGVRLTPRRVVYYLSLVRPLAARTHRPLIATVFRPTRALMERYPYRDMAPYVDAFAPMVYWSCNEPGAAGASAVRMLSELAPVHVIGQGYDMYEEGGRQGMPSGAEVARFCDASRRAGAMGASLWHWQTLTDDEWSALGSCWWPPRRAQRARREGRGGAG